MGNLIFIASRHVNSGNKHWRAMLPCQARFEEQGICSVGDHIIINKRGRDGRRLLPIMDYGEHASFTFSRSTGRPGNGVINHCEAFVTRP